MYKQIQVQATFDSEVHPTERMTRLCTKTLAERCVINWSRS